MAWDKRDQLWESIFKTYRKAYVSNHLNLYDWAFFYLCVGPVVLTYQHGNLTGNLKPHWWSSQIELTQGEMLDFLDPFLEKFSQNAKKLELKMENEKIKQEEKRNKIIQKAKNKLLKEGKS